MVFVRISNNRDLLVQVCNYLASKAADYNTIYGEIPENLTDAWVITNTQASVLDMSRVLYFGSNCPPGAVQVSKVEDLGGYLKEELVETANAVDLESIIELGAFDPIDCVYDLVVKMNERMAEQAVSDPFAGMLEEMQRASQVIEEPKVGTEPVEEDIPAYAGPAEVIVPDGYGDGEPELEPESSYIEQESEEYAEPEPELEYAEPEPKLEYAEPEPPVRVEPPARVEPPRTARVQPRSNPPRIVQPSVDDGALIPTGIETQTIRRRSRVQQAMDKSSPAPLGRRGAVKTRRDSGIARRIYVVTGTSNNCGVSSFCYSLAAALSKSTYEKTLLVDMDVLKPTLTKKLSGIYDLDIDADDTIDNFSTMHLDDLLTNVEYLVSKIAPSTGGHFSLIRGSALSFKNRKVLCNMDYTETFDMLSEVYQNIILDLGAYNGAQPYQDSLINNHYCTIVLLDCSSVDSAKEAVDIASQIGEEYKAVLSKCDTRVNPFKIQNSLHRPVLGKILSRTSAGDIWRTGEPFGAIKEALFKEDWAMLVDEVKRM